MSLRDPKTYAVIGSAMEVHAELGEGFLEGVYHAALIHEFTLRNIPYISEPLFEIGYKGQVLPCQYKADFLCFQEVVVEIKAVNQLTAAHYAQVLNELKASRQELGLLINFGAKSLEYKRVFLSRPSPLGDEEDPLDLNYSPGAQKPKSSSLSNA